MTLQQALAGLKVLDLSMNLPGPYLTWLLAGLGARVLKLEPPGGDYMRRAGAVGPLYFQAVNRNKESLALNLKHPQGVATFFRLLEQYDVVVEGFRPGTLERLGIGYEEMARRHPGLILVSISGYGSEGPYRDRAGHDLNYLALSGVLAMSGSRGGPPGLSGVQLADLFGGSLLALAGLLVALLQRERTGRGQRVEAAMFDGALSLASMVAAGVAAGVEEPRPGGMMLNGAAPCYNIYTTADGGHMALGALEAKFWQEFCRAVDRPDLLERQFDPSAVEEVATVFAGRSRARWEELFAGLNCCCEPVLDLKEVLAGDLARARGMVSDAGRGFLASPLRLPDSPPVPDRPAPELGQHSRQVLEQAGLSPVEVEELITLGVVRQKEAP